MAHPNALPRLLSDMIRHPARTGQQHKHDKNRKGKGGERSHELTDPYKKMDAIYSAGLVRDKFPNFEKIGFTVQAFIDIKLTRLSNPENGVDVGKHVKSKLFEFNNVLFVYTVFGDVDLRCKVVGIQTRDIEKTALKIREIDGVGSSTSSIIIDETDYDAARVRWQELILENEDKLASILSGIN